MSTPDIELVMLNEVQTLLDKWESRYAGRPEQERARLLMLALEREQIVAVAYREEAVAGRVADLIVDDDAKALIRQTLVWIWKDEQLHAEYLRGELLHGGGLASRLVVYGRQIQGTLSGWTSATANHLEPATAPFRAGAAGALVAVAGVTRQAPPALLKELRFQTFRRYCELNVALEASAALAYRRIARLASNEEQRQTIEQIGEDEERHVKAFRVLAGAIGDDDKLVEGVSVQQMRRELQAISPWYVPARLRVDSNLAPRSGFGSGGGVVVRSGQSDGDKSEVLRRCLDAAGLADAVSGARSVVIRASFMLGYDRRDRSNVNDPDLVAGLAKYLRHHGVADVAVLETPTVYGNSFAHRSVSSVAEYFGYDDPAYHIIDMSQHMRPFTFERGYVQRAISANWLDADFRIVMPKLRTDPTEFAHLCLSSLEGSTGPIDDTFYAGRRVDFRSATMMLLDVAPPDFGVVDAWAPVADGPFGVMGCTHPASVRSVYAGSDVLAVDAAVLADLGISDPRAAPIVRKACHWFGISPGTRDVDGTRPNLGAQLRGAHSSKTLRLLGTASYPVYMYLSDAGERFVPAMDSEAFPELREPGVFTAGVRWFTQQAFGLHPADNDNRQSGQRR